MLVLSRRRGETVEIGGVVVTVLKIERNEIKLGFVAPPGTEIWRGELADEIRAGGRG